MVLFTVDTCVLIALQKDEPEHDIDSIRQLFRAALTGRVCLQLTAAFERDCVRNIQTTGAVQRAEDLLDWVSGQPVMPERAGGAFRLDVSTFGGDDLVCDEEMVELSDRLEALLPEPKVKRSRQDVAYRYSDIDHLLAHHLSKADAFVTIDRATILDFQKDLESLGLTVCTPAEAVRMLS